MLRQERFQDALRERRDLRDVRDTCIRDRRKAMSVPVNQPKSRPVGANVFSLTWFGSPRSIRHPRCT